MIKKGSLGAALLVMSVDVQAAQAAEVEAMAGVSLGMTYEEADQALLAEGYTHSKYGRGIYTDRRLGRIADLHIKRVSDSGSRLDVPVAVSFPYSKDGGKAVTLTLLEGDASGPVVKVVLRQSFKEPYPGNKSTGTAFAQKYGLAGKQPSCFYKGEAGFHFSKSTGEIVQATDLQSYRCRSGLDFSSMKSFTSQVSEYFEDPLDIDYAVTFKASTGYGRAPRGHIADLETSIGYYHDVITGVADTVEAARAANTKAPEKVEF